MSTTYATREQLKEYLNITVSDDDALLDRLLASATQIINSFTQRRFIATEQTRLITTVRHQYLFLHDDIAQLLEVRDLDDNTIDITTVYTHAYPTRVLYRKMTIWPRDGVKVRALWGYSVTPPADIVQICIRLAAYLYRQKDAQVFDVLGQSATGTLTLPAGVPSDVKQMLDNYRVRSVVL